MGSNISLDVYPLDSGFYKGMQYLARAIYAIFIFLHVIGPTRLVVLHPEISGLFTLISKDCLFLLIVIGLTAVIKSKKNIALFTVSIGILIIVKMSLHSSGVAFGGLTALYLLFFILPVAGFPQIFITDFVARLAGYGFTILVLNHWATLNVWNPVTHQWKFGFGFANPNILGINSFVLLLELAILYRFFNRFIWFGLGSIFLIILFLSHSRTCIWAFMIFIFVWIIIENHRFYSTRWLKYFVLLLPVIMLGLSIFFIYWYRISPHNPFVKIFDLFVSNRLSLGSKFLEEYGIKWGAAFVNNAEYNLDMGQVSLLLTNGVIATTVFLSYYGLANWNLLRLKYWEFIPAMIAFLCVSLTETSFARITSNPFLLTFGLMMTQFDTLEYLEIIRNRY